MTSTPAADVAPPAPTPARHRRPCPPSAPSGALTSGVICLLLTAACAAVVLAGPQRPVFQGIDDTWLRWMGGPHDGLGAAVAAALNWLGGPTGVVIPLGLLILLALRRRWPSLLFLLTTYGLGNFVVVQALKFGVDRPRPAHPLVRVDHGSFPSGHSAGTALLVVVVGVLFIPEGRRRAWWAFGAVLTAAMMWSRTWLHAHWLSDTLAGATAGTGTALVLWWLFSPLLTREGAEQPSPEAEGPSGS